MWWYGAELQQDLETLFEMRFNACDVSIWNSMQINSSSDNDCSNSASHASSDVASKSNSSNSANNNSSKIQSRQGTAATKMQATTVVMVKAATTEISIKNNTSIKTFVIDFPVGNGNQLYWGVFSFILLILPSLLTKSKQYTSSQNHKQNIIEQNFIKNATKIVIEKQTQCIYIRVNFF